MATPRRLLHQMNPAQRGALLAILGTAVILVAVSASEVRLGFGTVGDVVLGLVAFGVLGLGYAVLIAGVGHYARRLLTPQRAFIVGALLAGAVALGILAGLGPVRLLAGAVLFTAGWWGAAIATLLSPERRRAGRRPYVLLAIAVASTIALVQSATSPFDAPDLPAAGRTTAALIPPGRFAVTSFRYGSGDDARRKTQYGRDAALRTAPVDISFILPGHHGFRALVHQRYWGVDVHAAPVNATVWLPEGSGRVPLALLLHGAGTDESSEEGLAYLGERLANRGIAAVSIDANFLSGPWIREGDGGVSARERLVLAHLATLDALDRDARAPLAGRIDRSRIVLIGHSRGGEAMAAVAMNRGRIPGSPVPTVGVDTTMRVRAVVALSPTEGLLQPNGHDLTLEDVSYLLVRGSQDADVPPEAGAGQYSRVEWTQESHDFKAAVVILGANHSQFNARWGRRDLAPPLGWLLRDAPVLDGTVQRDVTAATVLAFLDEALAQESGAFRRFEHRVDDLAAQSGVPIRRRVASARTNLLATFEQDADPFRGDRPGVHIGAEGFSIWREWRRRRTGNTSVQLVWPGQAEPARYTISLTREHPEVPVGPGAQLVFAAAGTAGPQSLVVEIETRDGRRHSATVEVAVDPEFSRLAPRWRSQLLEGQLVLGTFPSLHTYIVPLDSLGATAALARVHFVAPAGQPGAVMLDDIGIRPPPR